MKNWKIMKLLKGLWNRMLENYRQRAYWLKKWEITWKNTLVTAAILIAVTLVA